MKSLLLPVGAWLRAVGLALLPLGSAWRGRVQVEVRDAAADEPLDQAVVYLESAEARRQVRPMHGVAMAQQQKQFVPAVLVTTVGTEVQFPNMDEDRIIPRSLHLDMIIRLHLDVRLLEFQEPENRQLLISH